MLQFGTCSALGPPSLEMLICIESERAHPARWAPSAWSAACRFAGMPTSRLQALQPLPVCTLCHAYLEEAAAAAKASAAPVVLANEVAGAVPCGMGAPQARTQGTCGRARLCKSRGDAA